MPRLILEGQPARRALGRGAGQLARAVQVTLGPRGRPVLVERPLTGPAILNDGSAVAREVELPDPFEDMGVRLVREAAQKTFDEAGDGVTTTIVLAHAIVARGLERLDEGALPVRLRRGIEQAARAVLAGLRAQARPLGTREERLAVAAIGAGGDLATGALVEEALTRAGTAGAVTLSLGPSNATRLLFTPGLAFERGWLSAYFVTDPSEMCAVLEQPLVLLADARLALAEDVAPALAAARAASLPLLVIAEDIEGGALETLIVNQLRGVADSCAVQAPGRGRGRRAWLERLAGVTGATLADRDDGRAPADAALGRLARAVIERGRTTLAFAGDPAPPVEGGVVTIEIGGESGAVREEAYARCEDALSALSSALAEGVLPGGGVAFLRARDAALGIALDADARAGAEAVREALLEPARWIAHNAGADGDEVVKDLLRASGGAGFDASLGRIVDLPRAGILDPARVVRVALENAASVAGLLLTTETLVVGEDDPPAEEPGGEAS